MKKVTVKLGLSKLTVSEKTEKADLILISMKDNSLFPDPDPSLAELETLNGKVKSAIIAAKTGGPEKTALLHELESELELSLKRLASYVELIANKNISNSESIVLGSGFELRDFTPPMREEFSVKRGSATGEINISTVYEKNKVYMFQITTTPDKEDTWQTIYIGTNSTKKVQNLKPGNTYFFRFAQNQNDLMGPWSEVISCIAV